VPELARLCRTRTTQDWLTALGACGVPCGPINDLAAVYADPQVRHRGLSFALPHPESGQVPQVRNPVRYSRTEIEYEVAPPLLGQHTDQVLAAELGLTARELGELRASGVIA